MTIIYTPPVIINESQDTQQDFDTLFYSLRSLTDDVNLEIEEKVQLPGVGAKLYLFKYHGGF